MPLDKPLSFNASACSSQGVDWCFMCLIHCVVWFMWNSVTLQMSGGVSPHQLHGLGKMQAVTLDKSPAVVCRVREVLENPACWWFSKLKDTVPWFKKKRASRNNKALGDFHLKFHIKYIVGIISKIVIELFFFLMEYTLKIRIFRIHWNIFISTYLVSRAFDIQIFKVFFFFNRHNWFCQNVCGRGLGLPAYKTEKWGLISRLASLYQATSCILQSNVNRCLGYSLGCILCIWMALRTKKDGSSNGIK